MLINTKIFYKLIVSLLVCVARHAQSTQNNKSAISLHIICLVVNAKVFYEFSISFLKVSKTATLQCLCNISKKKWDMKLLFLHANKFKVSCKFFLTLQALRFTRNWYYHYWWAWSTILKVVKVRSLQYLKEEVRDGVHFLHEEKY